MKSAPFDASIGWGNEWEGAMNADRMIGMAIRMIMRKLMRRGIGGGIDKVAGGRREDDRTGPDGRKTARNAGRTLRLMRRIGRF